MSLWLGAKNTFASSHLPSRTLLDGEGMTNKQILKGFNLVRGKGGVIHCPRFGGINGIRRLGPDIDFRGRDVRSVFGGDSKDFLVNLLVEVGGGESGAKFGDLLRVFQEEGASRELDIELIAIDRDPKAMLVGNST